MKTQLESIQPNFNSSFNLLRNDYLSDTFLWHFHPEYELVYIDNASGTRHVGNHISKYKESDLVFIGSTIPHLNFDYGVKTAYNNIVLHIHPDFVVNVLEKTPELFLILKMFQKGQHGLSFPESIKVLVGKKIKKLGNLNAFDRYLEVLKIFEIIANSDFKLLHEKPFINQFSLKEQKRLQLIYQYTEQHYHSKITINTVANLCNLSNEAFCRYFKKVTGNSFITFLNQYRISKAKTIMMSGKNVSEACFESGFESLSYFNRIFKKVTQENPSHFINQLHK
ncbi:AraC family transcriptional regulator [Galbibacter orientalis]|uniref:AraC family transcriptional regulator n=1 Tax=Galbibacter orientalis TaxID=453852 RepID=UPI00308009E5